MEVSRNLIERKCGSIPEKHNKVRIERGTSGRQMKNQLDRQEKRLQQRLNGEERRRGFITRSKRREIRELDEQCEEPNKSNKL